MHLSLMASLQQLQGPPVLTAKGLYITPVPRLQSADFRNTFLLRLSRSLSRKSAMLPLKRSPQLRGVSLMPGLQLRSQGREVLPVSVLEEPQLAGVPLLGLP